MRWAFWRRRGPAKPSEELLETLRQYREVQRGDRAVDDLVRRARKLEQENNFGPAIARALGLGRQ